MELAQAQLEARVHGPLPLRAIIPVAVLGPVVWFLEWRGAPREAATSLLPHVNAVFNLIATCFIVAGYRAIKRGQIELHRAHMITALVASAEFLVGYLSYHSLYKHIVYTGTGVIRLAYYSILISHIFLSVVIAVLVPIVVVSALRNRFDRHRRIARVTTPIWLYVSVTGVLVYLMLRVG